MRRAGSRWGAGEVFAACVARPGLRAVIVCREMRGYQEVFAVVRRLLVPEVEVLVGGRGHVLRFPHGSQLWLRVLAGAQAVEVFGGGAVFHLVVVDGLEADDEAYLATRARAAGPGLPALGAHRLVRAAPALPQPRV